MRIYIYLLLKSHLCLLILIVITYLIEVITGKLLLVRWFKYKKDLKSAEGTADREAFLYFMFNIVYVIYKAYIKNDISHGFSFIIWLLIITVLSIVVRKLYFKYQGIDPSKPDYGGFLD